MFKQITLSLVALLLAAGTAFCPSTGLAQSDITAWYNQQVAQNNQYFQQMENQITYQNMQNPQVQRRYQQYQQQGGNGSFENFAFGWAATGGYSPEGMNYWNQSQAQIHRRDHQSRSDYNNYTTNLWAETNQYRNQVQDKMAYHRGELLSGNGTYVDPWSGSHYTLPSTSGTGTIHQDYYGHNQFQMDSFGTYWMQHPQTGLWYSMNRY